MWPGENKVPGIHLRLGCNTTGPGVSENLIFKFLGCAVLVGSLYRLITFNINVAWGQQNEHCGSCRAKQQAFTCAFLAMQQGILENLIFKFLDCAADGSTDGSTDDICSFFHCCLPFNVGAQKLIKQLSPSHKVVKRQNCAAL